jgi:hypothetical protein
MKSSLNLAWDSVAEKLTPVTKQFLMKSTLGPIEASLVAPATLANTSATRVDPIKLDITMDGKLLSTTSVTVSEKTEALSGKLANFTVAALAPADGFVPGSYQGNVYLTFDSVAPPEE